MGVKISSIIPRTEIKLSDLSGKKIAIDTYIELYQFLKSMPRFTNKEGLVSTHLIGLFNRTVHLMELGIKPIFIFDGQTPEIRRHRRITFGNFLPKINKTITQDIIDSSKELILALGLPVIQAPSEGEAQAAFLCEQNDAWAVASEDFDSLIFGAKRMIQNFTISKTKVQSNKKKVLIGTYIIELEKVLEELTITQDELIVLAILCGTDFNKGIDGIGQKRGLTLIKKYKNNFDDLFEEVKWKNTLFPNNSWKDIFYFLKTMPVTDTYTLEWKEIDKERILRLLVDTYQFNKENVERMLKKVS